MKCKHNKYLFIILIQCMLNGPAVAAEEPSILHLGIEHGLSNNAVTCIYQDHNGFMWFGTYDGLNRYDGYAFKIFRNIIGNKNSLSDNHIYTINGDLYNNIWVGGAKGISIYNTAHSNFYSPRFTTAANQIKELTSEIHVIRSAWNNMMFAGSQQDGLLLFENNSHTGTQIPLKELQAKATSYHVSAIESDSLNNAMWVFVQQLGLCRFDVKTKTLKLLNSTFKQGNCLQLDKSGRLWLGTANGLFQYDDLNNTYSNNFLPVKNNVASIAQDKQNKCWIATDGSGLWQLPQGMQQAIPYVSAKNIPLINSNAVYAVYEDAEERKWIGTLRGGINIIEPRTSFFKRITYDVPGNSSVINNFILSFHEQDNKNIWIGTDGAGLRKWDRENSSFIQYTNSPPDKNSISSNFITSITKDAENDIWISTWFGGINRLQKNGAAFDHFSCLNPFTNAEENNVWLIYKDRQQKLWASTTNDGTLYTFNYVTQTFELFDTSIINIQSLAEDSNGAFWGGNYTSLIKIDRNNKQHKFVYIGYPVRCIHEDRNKNFWIGTEGGGLLLFDRATGSYKRFTTSEGLPNNSILRLLEDHKGNLWLSTYNGLCKFNTVSKSAKNFSQSDGLQSNQFSFNASLELESGEFLFGGIKGFNIFYPDSIYDRTEIPKMFLTGLKVNNTPVEEDSAYIIKRSFDKISELTIPYDRGVLSLEFLALEFTGADKIQYAYMLEGWDKDWNYVNNIRTANYSRLQEGHYTFKIKVTNADGVWSKEETLIKITVLPPWYRTWWAYLLYMISFASLIYLYILYNKRQERLRYEIKLAHLENEEEKKLTERKISFFTHISHEFRTPLTLIINPLKQLVTGKKSEADHKDISMVYRNARRLLSLVDQLLLFRKVESIDKQMRIEQFDMVEVCNEVFLSFAQHALSKQINFTFNRNDHEIMLYADKEKIEIILFNLVSNAFKYTAASGTITLEIAEQEKDIQVIVKDSGTGIPDGVGDKLFESFYQAADHDKVTHTGFGIGLYVSQNLAKAHQGNLSYSSVVGTGTSFFLRLLKGKEHFAAYSIHENNSGGETILHELVEDPAEDGIETQAKQNSADIIDKLTSRLPTMVIVDDNAEIRAYLRRIFTGAFKMYDADDGSGGYQLVMKEQPDIVISDIMMKNVSGIELCRKIKDTPAVAHIPVILLTASSSDEIKLKGIEGGAEDYITKPFDMEIIQAKVRNILKSRNRLQQYFFNAVTLKPDANMAGEHKEFVERCIAIVEKHLDNPDFTIQTFSREIGMSHPSLYKKVKAISGLTINVFIRYLRLRKAAELLINTDKTIVEVTYITGFNDIKYFREQFFKLFNMNPSEYIKKYRKILGSKPTDN